MCDEASFHLECVCFGWKWFQEIIFTLFRMFGCNGKYSFPEIVFLLTRIYAFDLDMNLRSHFHFNSFPERERERERKERAQIRERVREERAQIGEHRSSIALLVGRSHSADERRDRRAQSMGSRGFWFDEIASLVIARRPDDRIAPIWALSSLTIGDSFSFAGFWFLLPDLMHFL